jgi:hypothetical protein
METYKEIYEFASSAGALEGYVYLRSRSEIAGLDNWINNLVKQHRNLPIDVRESFQTSLDRTIGRAVQSLIPVFGKDHDHIKALESLVKGKMPDSPNDFEEEKEEKSKKYGA